MGLHSRMALQAAEALDSLSEREPVIAALLRRYITHLRAENARNRGMQVSELRLKLASSPPYQPPKAAHTLEASAVLESVNG